VTRYLFDTNHLSKYLDRHAALELKVDAALRAGHRFGISLPVLCNTARALRPAADHNEIFKRLIAAMGIFRLWPADQKTAAEFASLFVELRQMGRMLSQFDLLIAAQARQQGVTLLTADSDCQIVPSLTIENWLT
jgi:predicted nucleic acid-binding protein